jgi:hypothetical protein
MVYRPKLGAIANNNNPNKKKKNKKHTNKQKHNFRTVHVNK